MFTKSIIAGAIMLGTATAASAVTKHGEAPLQNVYNPRGAYLGSDPDLNVLFEPWRNDDRGHESLPPEASGRSTTGRF
jgi:hypothetical protein